LVLILVLNGQTKGAGAMSNEIEFLEARETPTIVWY